MAECKECGFKFDAREYYDVISNVTEKKEEAKGQIKMKVKGNDLG